MNIDKFDDDLMFTPDFELNTPQIYVNGEWFIVLADDVARDIIHIGAEPIEHKEILDNIKSGVYDTEVNRWSEVGYTKINSRVNLKETLEEVA